MERATWAWVIFPTIAKAAQFRDELAGTPALQVILPDGREVEVPPVLISGDPVALTDGRGGFVCHWWGGNTGEPEADAVIRDTISVMARHSRYGGEVSFGHEAPAEWQVEEVV